MLDESSARVRMLVAPAGYGKTTLAGQWASRDGCRAAWYTARRASTDVAALALGMARVASEIVPGCDERLREHLRAVPNPGQHVDVLAELLGEDLSDWSSSDWLVLDEYQEVVGARDAERFVEDLVAACPVQLLIASRQRPSWVTGRSILYGEVLELNQFALAMNSHEAAEVLGHERAQSASGLVALANGWPAVIALASVSSAEIDGEEEVPESLYRFFAEEVFNALGQEVRDGLATLAVAPLLDRELAAELLGVESFEHVCAAALDVGLLEERGAQLELHPLARSFLDERRELRPESDGVAIERCLGHFKARRDWDAAFDLIARRGPAEGLEALLLAALDDLLNGARLSTIESWCELAATSHLEAPAFALARAEVALRHGRHSEAQAFAEVAAEDGSELAFRALSVAGRAAHLASREEEALALHRRAEIVANTEANRRDALWGQLMCATELELADAAETLSQLSAGVRISDPRDLVRASACTLMYQLRLGSLDLKEADLAWELLGSFSDPLVESSFQNAYAHGLVLSARYEEALLVGSALLKTVHRYRLTFALPYAHCTIGMAHAGLRNWHGATELFELGIATARANRNSHAEQSCYSGLIRALAQEGKAPRALALPVPETTSLMPAMQAEVLTSRGLVFASVGLVEDAMAFARDARGLTRAIEPAVLLAGIEAVVGLRRREPDVGDRVASLEDVAFASGALDLLVTAYRSVPDLLPELRRNSSQKDRLRKLLERAGDQDLAEAAGISPAAHDARSRLTPREREVYDLICRGLSNRQIAETLFISESTAKLHAHHIYDKVGIRSRTALIIQAALERADQATSATRDSGCESDS